MSGDRFDLESYLDARRAEIDAALERFLPSAAECPPIVADAMRYSVTAGGKRLRPVLTLAAAEAVAPRAGLPEAEARRLALPAACAIELVHTYSLVHDDLPAMDDDRLRRGRPTAHVVFGEGLAILAGDALLTRAFEILARYPEDNDGGLAPRKLRTLALVARAAGAAGMVGGQAIDLAAAGKGRPSSPPLALDAAALRGMHERKTGALIRAAVVAGAVMTGAGEDLVAALEGYGAELGLAFQIVDDILDVEGASERLGKTAGKDAVAGKPTYPAVHGLVESRRLAAECTARAEAAVAGAGLGGALLQLARWVLDRTA